MNVRVRILYLRIVIASFGARSMQTPFEPHCSTGFTEGMIRQVLIKCAVVLPRYIDRESRLALRSVITRCVCVFVVMQVL